LIVWQARQIFQIALQQDPLGPESFIGELHGVFANINVALVVMHILGVGLASFVHRENLVLAMISGGKRRARD
jgi:cytochrome b